MHKENLNTPAPGPEITDEANNNFVDLSIDSWLTIDSIGTTPAIENVLPNLNRRLFGRILNILIIISNYPCWILTRTVKLQHY